MSRRRRSRRSAIWHRRTRRLAARAARWAIRRLKAKAAEVYDRRWRRAFVGGGRVEIDFIHGEMRALEREARRREELAELERRARQQTRARRAATMANNGSSLALPEGRKIEESAKQLERWDPESAHDVHQMLYTLSRVCVALGALQLAVAETLATHRADPRRIVDPLIEIARVQGDLGESVDRVIHMFVTLYAGDLEQSESGVRPMVYGAKR